MTEKELDENIEREIVHFIHQFASARHDTDQKFIFPVLPNPKMGEEFFNKHVKIQELVSVWMKDNPEKIEEAERNGYIEKKIDYNARGGYNSPM